MIDPKIFDDMAKHLSEALPDMPEGLKHVKADMEKQFKIILQSTFTKLDLVTREEFDTQTKVLLKTRQKIEALEKALDALEKQGTHGDKSKG